MEIRTCEEYVLAELERVRNINDGYIIAINKLREERDELKAERERLETQCERMARKLNEMGCEVVFEPVREVPDGD